MIINYDSPPSDICDRSWFWLSCLGPLVSLLPKPLNYVAFQSFDFERNWLFQNRVVHNKFDIFVFIFKRQIKVITKLPNSEQPHKGKVKTHNHINRQNQSTTGKLWKPQWPWLGTGISNEVMSKPRLLNPYLYTFSILLYENPSFIIVSAERFN